MLHMKQIFEQGHLEKIKDEFIAYFKKRLRMGMDDQTPQ